MMLDLRGWLLAPARLMCHSPWTRNLLLSPAMSRSLVARTRVLPVLALGPAWLALLGAAEHEQK
jgi:hypothetical protein